MTFLQTLHQYVADGKLEMQRHPHLPLSIFNYSREVQFSKEWDEITLQCRGLIVADDGMIVARPFGKFFNIEEHDWQVPNLPFETYVKEDGSLGIVFWYEGQWHVATRGSFTSDQAVKGKEMLDAILEKAPRSLDRQCTYLFEIIY